MRTIKFIPTRYLCSSRTVSTLCAYTSRPDRAIFSTAARSPRKSGVRHSTRIWGFLQEGNSMDGSLLWSIPVGKKKSRDAEFVYLSFRWETVLAKCSAPPSAISTQNKEQIGIRKRPLKYSSFQELHFPLWRCSSRVICYNQSGLCSHCGLWKPKTIRHDYFLSFKPTWLICAHSLFFFTFLKSSAPVLIYILIYIWICSAQSLMLKIQCIAHPAAFKLKVVDLATEKASHLQKPEIPDPFFFFPLVFVH